MLPRICLSSRRGVPLVLRVACPSLIVISLLVPAIGMAIDPAPRPQVEPTRRSAVESRVKLPERSDHGPTRVVPIKDYRIELHLARQVLNISTPKEESWRTPDEKFRQGDVISITGKGKSLRAGKDALAELNDGQLLSVNEVKGDWVAASVVAGGARKSGWVHANDVRFVAEDPRLSPTITPSGKDCVGASLLAQKAKQFDDGLYAAVELAAQSGGGKFAGKNELLGKLSASLGKLESLDEGNAVAAIMAACRVGGLKSEYSKPVEAAVTAQVARFRADELRSKPLGFYTWSDDLRRIFQQDRLLQTELTGQDQIAKVAEALHADPKSRETYEAYLKLVSGLTNPLNKPDLRPVLEGLDKGQAPSAEDKVHFFPPSRAHETDLVMRLFANRPIPEGFNLADELLSRVQAGQIDLTPRPESGWYDYQTWSLEPLAIPEKMPESARLKFDETYKKQLRELFKGVLALTRETHIKQLDIPAPGAESPHSEPRPIVYLAPELTAEPLPSVYLRRAISYRFVRRVLEETFGAEALREMHRQTAAGAIAENLSDELTKMEGLMFGAYAVSMLQIGMLPDEKAAAGSGQGVTADAAAFLHWAANLDLDADLGRDVRMMVPVFYDQQRKLTKVWAFLGWTEKRVNVAFARQPGVAVFDKEGKPVPEGKGPDVQFFGTGWSLAYPVVAEVYVSRVLDRDEFRRHCDTYASRSVILKNLP